MAEFAKATIVIGDKTITLEGPPSFVEAQLERITAMTSSKEQAKGVAGNESVEGMNERELVAAKNPKNHPETVAVLAFSLAQSGVEEFTEDDIKRAYIRAGVRPPKVVAQALRDAKNGYDYIEPGSSRGSYRLTTHGERTVRFDLPSSD